MYITYDPNTRLYAARTEEPYGICALFAETNSLFNFIAMFHWQEVTLSRTIPDLSVFMERSSLAYWIVEEE